MTLKFKMNVLFQLVSLSKKGVFFDLQQNQVSPRKQSGIDLFSCSYFNIKKKKKVILFWDASTLIPPTHPAEAQNSK